MAYIRVQDRTKTKSPFSLDNLKFAEGDVSKVDINTRVSTKTAQSTPERKYTPVSQRFGLGEGLDKTAEVLPFPFKKSAEQARQADIFGQDINVGLEAPDAPLGKTVSGAYIPVGVRVKIPFTQKGFTLPEDSFGHITKDIVESPEKLIKSAYYQSLTNEEKEAFKIKGSVICC